MTSTALPDPATRIRLTDAGRGVAWRVATIPADDAGELLAEGLVPGAVVVPEVRAPFRGPVIVRVGRARVAVSQAVARRVVVESLQPARSVEPVLGRGLVGDPSEAAP